MNPHVQVIYTFGECNHTLRDAADVMPQILGNDVEVASSLYGTFVNLPTKLVETRAQAHQLLTDGPEAVLQGADLLLHCPELLLQGTDVSAHPSVSG